VKRRHDWASIIVCAIAILIAAAGLWWLYAQHRDCNVAGGTLIRAAVGYACIHEVRAP
jgi:hypothetical protein